MSDEHCGYWSVCTVEFGWCLPQKSVICLSLSDLEAVWSEFAGPRWWNKSCLSRIVEIPVDYFRLALGFLNAIYLRWRKQSSQKFGTSLATCWLGTGLLRVYQEIDSNSNLDQIIEFEYLHNLVKHISLEEKCFITCCVFLDSVLIFLNVIRILTYSPASSCSML